MSSGPRFPLEQANDLAQQLGVRWGFQRVSALGPVWIVGSVRRCQLTVGDLEFLCPHEPKEHDTLYDAIEATLLMPCQQDSIFQAACVAHIGKPVQGFKRGFLSASFLLRSGLGEVPVQVFRYTPQNRGWQLLMRTGPAEFGQYFLGKWKDAFGIPKGVETAKASIDGHLVDKHGIVVPVETEEEAFHKAGIPFVSPQLRENWRKS